jgi:hypothetical protein
VNGLLHRSGCTDIKFASRIRRREGEKRKQEKVEMQIGKGKKNEQRKIYKTANKLIESKKEEVWIVGGWMDNGRGIHRWA